MSPALQAIGQPLRDHGLALLAEVEDPHDELLALVWGPRFDRQHALGLWARFSRRQPAQAVHTRCRRSCRWPTVSMVWTRAPSSACAASSCATAH